MILTDGRWTRTRGAGHTRALRSSTEASDGRLARVGVIDRSIERSPCVGVEASDGRLARVGVDPTEARCARPKDVGGCSWSEGCWGLDSVSGLRNAGVTVVKCLRSRLETQSIPREPFTGSDPVEPLGFDPRSRGWSSDLRIGTLCEAYRNIDSHTQHRVHHWSCAESKVQGQGIRRSPDQYLHQELGLY
jgi:hypothetical protein